MSFTVLLLVSASAMLMVLYIIGHYIPLTQNSFGMLWSPRLLVCKFLAPFDTALSLLTIFGGVTGLFTIVTGISMMLYNVLIAIGFSIGVYIIHRYLRPKWRKQFSITKEQFIVERELGKTRCA